MLAGESRYEHSLYLATLGSRLRKKFPEHPRIYEVLGFSSLGDFVKAIPGTVIEERGLTRSVRLKQTPVA